MGARSRSVSRAAALALLILAVSCGKEQLVSPTVRPAPTATTVPTPAPTGSPAPTPTGTPAPGSFDGAMAMEHVRVLSKEIGIRVSGTNGDSSAAQYIAGRLLNLGWSHEMRPFPLPQGGQSWNVVGTPPGFDETKQRYLIVGGHYDSKNGPGANDNGTGVAVALEIAREVSRMPAKLPVMFVAFGGEERQPYPQIRHHVGSRFFVPRMSAAAKKNLVAMINVDMVGLGSPLICGRMSVGPREGTNRCLQTARSLGVTAKERVTPDWSDNGTFLRAGMNAAWLWAGEDPCCNHSPKDTYEHVRPADVQRAGDVALAIVRSYVR